MKQNIAKSTKKKPLPLVSKIVTPLSKSNRHGDEEEQEKPEKARAKPEEASKEEGVG